MTDYPHRPTLYAQVLSDYAERGQYFDSMTSGAQHVLRETWKDRHPVEWGDLVVEALCDDTARRAVQIALRDTRHASQAISAIAAVVLRGVNIAVAHDLAEAVGALQDRDYFKSDLTNSEAVDQALRDSA